MRLVCISDTHGDHEQLDLPAGDVLIHAGDLTAHGRQNESRAFMCWLGAQNFEHKLCVAGNHDTFMEQQAATAARFAAESNVVLLNDSGYEINGFSFWGSPITPRFFNWSFMRDPGPPIEAHWNLIPEYTDVLITHGPPYGILDQVVRADGEIEHTGCPSLLTRVQEISPMVHLFGHIHECHGNVTQGSTCFHNISTMDQTYRIRYEPVVINLSDKNFGDN